MALSNWDTLAFDSEGQPCDGSMEGFMEGTSCEIYKNWMYVHSEKEWKKGDFIEHTIAEVTSGEIRVAGFTIEAIRGPQQAIFVKVESTKYHKQVKDEPYKRPDVRRMAGIGCYGFSEFDYGAVREKLGLGPEYEGAGTGYSCGVGGKKEDLVVHFFVKVDGKDEMKDFKLPNAEEYDFESKWIGVRPSTLAEFMTWLKSCGSNDEYNEWIAKIEKAEPLRVNQGDMYFARNAGIDLSVTPPGEAERPVMLDICDAMKEKTDD